MIILMKNFKRRFGGAMNPTQLWSSTGDLYALSYKGFFILAFIIPVVFWVMWQEAKVTNQYPKVSCYNDSCIFYFENGTSKRLPREKVPFDENGVVIKDQVNF